MADESKLQSDIQAAQQDVGSHESGPTSSTVSGNSAAGDDLPLGTGDTEKVTTNNPTSAQTLKDSAPSQEAAVDHEEAEGEGDYGEITDLPPAGPVKKRKKKTNKRPGSQRGLGKPTGFESFFADAPMTPEQYEEDKGLYDRDLHFVDRILTAISRFERTRKLTPERRDLFHRYLAYGDIAIGPNSFQGGQEMEGVDKTQLAAMLSQASVSDDKRNLGNETSLYEVDFLGCAKGFLSRRAKLSCGFETRENVQLVTSTLERFMDYLLQHDVCPEYRDQVLATRNFLRDATAEVWDAAEATRRLPGDFNIGCSTLFGGTFARDYDGETWWGPENNTENVFVGMKPEEAFQVVKFGVAGAASEAVYQEFVQILNDKSRGFGDASIKEHSGFEITRMEPPSRECVEIYTTQSERFRPVGRLYAKPWENPDAPPEDLTPAEQTALSLTSSAPNSGQKRIQEEEEYVFLVESILQSHLRVGMRVEATIRELDCGILFFDEVLNVYPSFDEFVCNEMMLGWKEPRPIKGAFNYVAGEDGGDDRDNDNDNQGDDDAEGNENGDGDENRNARGEKTVKAVPKEKISSNDDETLQALAEDVAEKVIIDDQDPY